MRGEDSPHARWFVRVWSLFTVACRRLVSRGTTTSPQRIWLTVFGVAFAVALLLIVTGLAIGIAAPTAGTDDSADYWLVPDSSGPSSPLVDTGGPTFGEVHATNERIVELDGVRYSTPVLTQVLGVATDDGTEYVIVVGVIPETAGESAMGLPTAGLTGSGSQAGSEWVGETVLSEGAGSVLEASSGDRLSLAREERPLTVAAVDQEASDVAGTAPIALMHLHDLQRITGADENDQAEMFLVETTDSAAVNELEGIYPQSSVLSGGELFAAEIFDSDLSVALGLVAVVVSVFVGTMVVVTTMGLEVATDRAQLATLAAIGFSRRSRLGLYSVQTLVLAAVGGVLGGLLGWVGISVANVIADSYFSTGTVAVSHPFLIGYGLVVALGIGLLTIPALAVTMRRLETDGGPDGV